MTESYIFNLRSLRVDVLFVFCFSISAYVSIAISHFLWFLADWHLLCNMRCDSLPSILLTFRFAFTTLQTIDYIENCGLCVFVVYHKLSFNILVNVEVWGPEIMTYSLTDPLKHYICDKWKFLSFWNGSFYLYPYFL